MKNGLFYDIKVKGARLLLKGLTKAGFFKFPRTVRIESTNICNSRCTTCTRDMMTRPSGVMDMALYKKLVDECAEYGVNSLHMHNFGEPLIDKTLCEKIRYAADRGIRTRLFSNLALLTPDLARGLIESGLDRIKISIDGGSRETFETIRRGLKYDKVVENLDMLIVERERLKSMTPHIGLSFVETDDNRVEKTDFVKRWKGMVDSIDITKYHNWAGGLEGSDGLDKRGLPCLRIWQTFTVLWNGEVALCCMDYDGKVKLGNVRDNSIAEVYLGIKLTRIREVHLKGEFKKLPVCYYCEARR